MTKAERLAAMQSRFQETVKSLRAKFGHETITTTEFRDNVRVHVDATHVYEILASLKSDGFDLLAELGGADYLHYPGAKDRYGVWYCLTKTSTGERITRAATNMNTAAKTARPSRICQVNSTSHRLGCSHAQPRHVSIAPAASEGPKGSELSRWTTS